MSETPEMPAEEWWPKGGDDDGNGAQWSSDLPRSAGAFLEVRQLHQEQAVQALRDVHGV